MRELMERLRGLEGTPLPSQTVLVERGPIMRFADAVRSADPVHRGPRVAKERGFRAVPAPLTFGFVMDHWGALPELQSDENGRDLVREVAGLMREADLLLLHGEQGFEYHRPIYAGDVLTREGRVSDVYERTGKSRMVFVVFQSLWRDESGTAVLTASFTLLGREKT